MLWNLSIEIRIHQMYEVWEIFNVLWGDRDLPLIDKKKTNPNIYFNNLKIFIM